MMNDFWIDIHTHSKNSNNKVIAILNQSTGEIDETQKNISLGIHPWKIDTENWPAQLEEIKVRAKNTNVKFIGETGLDKLKGPDLEIQKKVFEEHLKLALELRKPLIIHCVKAQSEVIEILKRRNFNLPVIFHGFDKKLSSAKDIIKNGFAISIGKSLFTKPEISKEVLQMIPHDRLFFETDDSKYSIQEIYTQAALISGQPLSYWQKIIFSNYQNLENE